MNISKPLQETSWVRSISGKGMFTACGMCPSSNSFGVRGSTQSTFGSPPAPSTPVLLLARPIASVGVR